MSDLVYNLVGDSKVSLRILMFVNIDLTEKFTVSSVLTLPDESYWLSLPLHIRKDEGFKWCDRQVRSCLSTFRRFSVFKVQKRFYQIMASMASNEFNENA